jgi:Mn2+/Fe2+ NRAMP family transporter
LVWALVFSIIATIILQEAAARITIASGKNLGEFIASKYQSGRKTLWALFLIVAFGCAAYEAGNIIGATSGLILLIKVHPYFFIIGIAIICAAILWIGNYRLIGNILGCVVALMGIVFIYAAINTDIPFKNGMGVHWLPGKFPLVSPLLVLGLIGTTIVPYNLFLASGISKGQEILEMRIGITVAILIGGIISIAIMIVGTNVSGEFSFFALGEELSKKAGPFIKTLFGIGLFAAGLSSAITAPLAAAITGQSLVGYDREDWGPRSLNFRKVWGVVLGIGLFFGVFNINSIAIIILAQALNGFLLPLVAIFLLFAVNDKNLLGAKYSNSIVSNLLMLGIVGVTVHLGLTNFYGALLKISDLFYTYDISMAKNVITILVVLFCGWKVFFKK